MNAARSDRNRALVIFGADVHMKLETELTSVLSFHVFDHEVREFARRLYWLDAKQKSEEGFHLIAKRK